MTSRVLWRTRAKATITELRHQALRVKLLVTAVTKASVWLLMKK